MKKIALNIFAIGVVAASMVSCEDAKYDVIENRVYIAEAAANTMSEIVMAPDATSVTANVTVRLAKAAPNDVKVTLGLSQASLDAYNQKNQTTYEMVPADSLTFAKDVLIKAGEVTASIPVEIAAFTGEAGVDYAVAIEILSSEGIEMTQTSNKFIYAIVSPLVQEVPKFFYDNGCRLQPADTDWGLSLPNYTLEWWSRVTGRYNEANGYSVNNQAIFSFGGGPELYIRFGDLVYSSGGSYKNNFLQIKTFGGQFDSGDPTQGKGLESGKWYHFAITYSANTSTTILYINGAQVSQLQNGTGDMIVDRLNMFDSGSQYFRDYVQMAQLRMWKVTRTPDQIANFMRKEVKYSDPSLIFYLPMNEMTVNAEGKNTLVDVTGNGHDMVIGEGGNNGGNNNVYGWAEYDFSSL